MHRRRLAVPALALLVLGAWTSVALRAGEPGSDPARPTSPGLSAGADECGRCHGELHLGWSLSTHALTVREVTEETAAPELRAGAEVVHGPGRTQFVRAGGAFLAETPGPDGTPWRVPVTHVVGKTRIEMLLTLLPDGRRQVLPAMREHGTGVWFDYTALYFAGAGSDPNVPPAVAPGDPSFWTGPVRSWDAQCSRCHLSGRDVAVPAADGAPAPRTTQRAWGLDCEACHGPSAEHVRHQDETREGADPIVHLRTLSRRRQVDACLVCHMEAEQIVPGWHPGEERDLLEFLDPTLLEDPDRVDPAGRPLELVYAGVSFWSSRCAEVGALRCVDCHDPHGGPNRSATRTAPRDDAQCARCHEALVAAPAAHSRHAAGSEGARCVNCHMPYLTVERGHGAITDHTIGIPRPGLVSDRVAQDACTWCHTGGRNAPLGAPPLSEPGVRQAFARWWPEAKQPAWLATLADARLGRHDSLTRLEALLADPAAPRFARATAPVLLTRLGPAAREHLVAHAGDADSLVRRRVADGLVYVERADAWAALGRLLDDPSAPVRAHASRAALLAPGRLKADAPMLGAVLRELEAQVAWVPDDDLRWERLADAYALAEQPTQELEAVRRLRRLDPDRVALREREARLVAQLKR